MIEGWTDPEDRLLARSVFGTDDLGTARGMILGWVAGQGFGRARVTAIELSVGAAATVSLADRSRIVAKVWPGTADARSLAAQMEAQAAMAARGFPAPAVLTELSHRAPTRREPASPVRSSSRTGRSYRPWRRRRARTRNRR